MSWFRRKPYPEELRLIAAHAENERARRGAELAKQTRCQHANTREDSFNGAIVCEDCDLRVKL